jgi:hypothetical protein
MTEQASVSQPGGLTKGTLRIRATCHGEYAGAPAGMVADAAGAIEPAAEDRAEAWIEADARIEADAADDPQAAVMNASATKQAPRLTPPARRTNAVDACMPVSQ